MPEIPKDTCAGDLLPLKGQLGLTDGSVSVSPTALFITKP